MSFTESSHLDAKNRDFVIPLDTGIQTLDSWTSSEGQKKKVMAFGTFDIFHPGHVYYLTEAERLGDSFTIVIARDERVAKLKGRRPRDDEETRQRNVAHAFRTAEVIMGDEEDIFVPLRLCTPDVLVFGYDQRVPEDKIKELFPAIEIARVGSYEPEKWKSSLLRAQKEKEAQELF
ncbi:adenylyltransferase/cytidyltransferase family protein [Candidatus Gracilibacteria bacterium]|nr:adenylyltransferase/cytidyltransferase family protein [Candidatus Gracilibacteria bacterium]